METQMLLARALDLLIPEAKLWGATSPGATVFMRPGVVASVTPATPDRSLFNWVVSDELASLRAAYADLAQAYGDAGVRAFTVWVSPGDTESAAFLAERGHKLDSRPIAMAAPMTELVIEDPGDLDWAETREASVVAALNDRAYGFPPPAFGAALTAWPSDPRWRGYVARMDGREVGCVMTYESEDGDCGVTAVASLPEARGHGIATRLLGRALAAARARGATTTSLQASPLGRPVYAKLGFRDLGELGMWEHRVPAP